MTTIVKDVDRLIFLMEEICILKDRIQPQDTGHLHTTVRVLGERVKEIKDKLSNGRTD